LNLIEATQSVFKHILERLTFGTSGTFQNLLELSRTLSFTVENNLMLFVFSGGFPHANN
jgi:hypothetical protein